VIISDYDDDAEAVIAADAVCWVSRCRLVGTVTTRTQSSTSHTSTQSRHRQPLKSTKTDRRRPGDGTPPPLKKDNPRPRSIRHRYTKGFRR